MQYTRTFILGTTDVSYPLTIPSTTKFLSILNPTDCKIEIYQGSVDINLVNIADVEFYCPVYQAETLPVPQGNGYEYTIVVRGGTVVNPDKVLTIIAADSNLNINGTYGGSAATSVVTIGGDSAGLARSAQLPSDLSGQGNLKVAVEEWSVTLDQLPAALGAEGGLKVELLGEVAVSNFPSSQDVMVSNFPASQEVTGTVIVGNEVTAPVPIVHAGWLRGTASSIKASATEAGVIPFPYPDTISLIFAISIISDITVKILDDGVEIFALKGPIAFAFQNPLNILGTNLSLDFSGAGDTYFQFS